MTTSQRPPLPLVVLISGGGSNLQAIIDAIDSQQLSAEIRAVISNRADAYGLQRAQQAGIATAILDHHDYPDRQLYDRALGDLIKSYQPALVVMAGFMRILTAELVSRFAGQMINIHPSLLPKYRGLHTHQRVLDAGDREHGATVHYVTEELDGGPLILQARVPVEATDTVETLAARVLTQEHRIFPAAIGWIGEGRIALQDGRVIRDGVVQEHPPQLDFGEAPIQ